MDNLSEIIKDDRVSRYDDLGPKRRELVQALERGDFALPEVRDAYEASLSTVESELRAIGSSKEVQDLVSSVGTQAIEGINQLKTLEETINIEDSQNADLIEELESRVKLTQEFFDENEPLSERAIDFVVGAGRAAVGATETTPTDQDESDLSFEISGTQGSPQTPEVSTPESSSETSRTEVTITLEDKFVQIGKRGHRVPYGHDGVIGSFNEYSTERREALKYLISHAGEKIKMREIVAHLTTIPECSVDDRRSTGANVRSWLVNKLTFRRSPIILIEGAKGGTTYSVSPNFEVELVEKTSKEQSEELSLDTGKDIELSSEEENEIIKFTNHELALIASRLNSMNYVLAGYGRPTVTDELLSRLRDATEEEERRPRTMAAIEREVEETLKKINNLLVDDDEFFRFIDQLDDSEPAYELIEYLFVLDEEDREFVRRLLSSKKDKGCRYSLAGNGQVEGSGISGEEIPIYDPKGKVIWPVDGTYDIKPTVPKDLETQEKNSDGLTTRVQEEDDDEFVQNQEDSKEDEPSDNNVKPILFNPMRGRIRYWTNEKGEQLEERRSVSRQNKRRRDGLDNAYNKTFNIALQMLRSGLDPNNNYTIDSLNGIIGRGLRKKAVDLSKGTGKRYDKRQVSMDELVQMHLYQSRKHGREAIGDENLNRVIARAVSDARIIADAD